jgi:hypothetical protein
VNFTLQATYSCYLISIIFTISLNAYMSVFPGIENKPLTDNPIKEKIG